MDKNLIEKIYQMIIEGKELTHQNLIIDGLTEENIRLLIGKKIIRLNQNNIYELYRTEKFHQYGIKLLIYGKYKEANICFEKCYEMSPNGRRINLQMLLRAIIKENYEEAYRIYENIEKNSKEKDILDNNLYLYLLNLIYSKKEYSARAKEFTYRDVVLENSIYNKDENNIRKAIYQNKFVYARTLVSDLISKKINEYSIKNELIKNMLNKVISLDKEHKSKLLNLAKTGQYNSINQILLEKADIKKLSKLENYILIVSGTITKILQTKKIPEINATFTCDMYTALINNNFSLALEINNDYHTMMGTKKEEDILNILLVKINELIKEIKTSKEEVILCNKEFIEALNSLTEIEKEIIIYEELAYYISSEKMSLTEATKKFGLKEETITMIKLVYIRDYYIEGMYSLGDSKLKEIEKIKNKTQKVITFIKELKINKRFYKDRIEFHTKKRSR